MPVTDSATAPPPAPDGFRLPTERVAEHAEDLADRAVADPGGGLTGVAELLQAVDRLLAVAVSTLIAADRRAVIATTGQTLPSWLRSVARRTGADAGMLAAAAERLGDMPATLAAFQRGVIAWGTVRGIVSETRTLTCEQRAWVDAALTADPDRLGRVDGDTIADDARRLADRARPDLQDDRADRAAASQHLVVQPAVDGSGGTLFATLDAEGFAAVTAAIDGIARDGKGRRVASNVEALRALARQRVTLTRDDVVGEDAGDDDADDATAPTDDDPDAAPAASTAHDTVGDRPDDTADTAGDRSDGYAAQPCDCAAGPSVRPAPSTARPEIIVVTDITMLTDPDLDRDPYAGIDGRGTDTRTLRGALDPARGVARILWRHDRPPPRLTRHAARRLACDATWRPVLVDEQGRVLGTAEPYAKVSTALRAALAARDGGCRFTGCHAPVEVCDTHHLTHRADGGPTAMPNLALLCAQHHIAVHEGGWKPHLDISTGAMTFTRRGTTLHSQPRLPVPPDTGDAGPPPRGRPRRPRQSLADHEHRGRGPGGRPPDHPRPATPPDQSPDPMQIAQPPEPLPF